MAVLVFLVYFSTVLVIEKKRNLAPRVYENTPFWPKNFKQFSGPSPDPFPVGRGGHPLLTLTLLASLAPRLGSRLRRSTLPPPTSTPGSAYVLELNEGQIRGGGAPLP